MKHIRKIPVLFLCLVISMPPRAHAMTVYDPLNYAINEIRNMIMTTEWAKELAVAMENLTELKTQTMEFFRVHAGLDEIMDSVISDPFRAFVAQGKTSLESAFRAVDLGTPGLEILQNPGGPSEILRVLQDVTGKIPEGNARPYIPFEEMMVVDAFDYARQIREAGSGTRSAADQISEQAGTASPKGAARLQAQGISSLMAIGQQSQEALAKLIELNATQIEQQTRVAKEAERERIEYLKDAGDFLESHFASLK